MKLSRFLAMGAGGAVCLCAISCSHTKTASHSRASGLALFSDRTTSFFSRMLPARVPVVEVRQKSLKDMPLGHEKALACQDQQGGWWFFRGPVNFKEPNLPASAAEPDGSLLPVKHGNRAE